MTNFLSRDQAEAVLRQSFAATAAAIIQDSKQQGKDDVVKALEESLIPFVEQIIPSLASTVSTASIGLALTAALKDQSEVRGIVAAAGVLTIRVKDDGSWNVSISDYGK